MVTLPTRTVDIEEQLCTQLRNEKADNCDLLLKILGNIRFLAQQGLAFRGAGDDENSNFVQLLKLCGDDDHRVSNWMQRKMNKYISPQGQNELIQTIALQCYCERDIVADI